MKKITLTATLIGVVMACLAAVGGLAGKWQGSVKLPDGNTYPANYEFQISDGKLTGTATAEGPSKVITDTRINGDGTITHPSSKGSWSCKGGEYVHVWEVFGVRGPYRLSPDGKRLIKIKDGSVSFSRN